MDFRTDVFNQWRKFVILVHNDNKTTTKIVN